MKYCSPYIYILFIIILNFTSCKNEPKNNITKLVQNTISEDIDYLNESMEMHYGFIQKRNDQNSEKVGKYFRAGQKLKMACDETRKYLELSKKKRLNVRNVADTIASLNMKLNNVLDSFNYLKNSNYIDSFLNTKYLFEKGLIEEEKQLLFKLYVNKILLVENKIVRDLAGSISDDGFGYGNYKMHVFNDCSKIKIGDCINSKIAPTNINEYNKMSFTIDHIYRNGKKINIEVEKNWNEGLGIIKICPKNVGFYTFTGKVFTNDYLGKTITYPFQGEFEVVE